MDNSSTYVYILKDTLKKKETILDKLVLLVEMQEKYLSSEDMDLEAFELSMKEKEPLIKKLDELDIGFERVFERVREELKDNKNKFKHDILELQELIRIITEKSIRIQSKEKKNQGCLSLNFSKKKQEVKSFKVSNQMANNYYKNMANSYQGESFF